ncbi:MAG: PQQ-binding-like beta-propeller repeat protein [Pseudomonadota bacterium]
MTRLTRHLAWLLLASLSLPALAQDREFVYFLNFVGTGGNTNADDIGVFDVRDRRLDQPLSAVAERLFDLEHLPGSEVIWFAEEGAVRAIDIRQGEVLQTIAVAGPEPQIALSPDGAMLYVLTRDGQLLAYDIATGQQTAAEPAQRGAQLSVDPSGRRVFWTARCCSDETVHVVDPVSLEEIDRIVLPSSSTSRIAVSPDSTTLAVTSSTLSTLMVVDLASNAVTTISLGAQPSLDLALSADGGTAYVQTEFNGVRVIDTGAEAAVAQLGQFSSALALSRDGSQLYLVDNSELAVADTTSNTILSRTPINGAVDKLLVGQVPRNLSGLMRGMRARIGQCTNTDNFFGFSFSFSAQNWFCPLDSLAVDPGTPVQVLLRGVVSNYRHAYLPSAFDDQLYVVALNGNQLVDRVPVGGNSNAVAVSPDGSEVYVASEDEEEVWVLDGVSHEVLARIPVNGNPERLALSPDATQLWASIDSPSEVNVIDLATRSMIAAIRTTGLPSELAFSPDGATAYVAINFFSTESVNVIDVANLALRGTIRLGFPISSLEVSQSGTRLYVVADPGSSVVVYDLALGLPIANIDLADDGRSVLESADGNLLYITDDSGALTYVETTTFSVVGTAAAPLEPRGIAQDAGTQLLYVAGEGDGGFQLFTPLTGLAGPSVQIGNLTRAWGDFLGPNISPHFAGRVDNAVTLTSYTCRNITTGQTLSTTVAPGTRTWDCTALGLATSSGDFAEVQMLVVSD